MDQRMMAAPGEQELQAKGLSPVAGWRVRLGRRLFWKIFVAFWLAMTAAGIVLLAVETTRTIRLTQRWRMVTADALAVYGNSVARDFAAGGPRAAQDFLTQMEHRTGIRAWIFDQNGEEISGYKDQERKKQPYWIRARMRQLVREAWYSDKCEFDDLRGLTLAAQPVRTKRGGRLILAGNLPDTRYDFWGAVPRVQALRLLAILSAAGAVSFLLARHLSAPLEQLRDAARRFADGDFSARAGAHLQARRDELSTLATDFDEMAARIETLLGEQRRLVEAQRRFLADIAHELRSPLARAGVALELARDGLGLNADALGGGSGAGNAPRDVLKHHSSLADALLRIEQENARLAELIDRLLVLSRLESGVLRQEFVPVDLVALVRAVALDADFEARGQGRKVTVVTPEECQVNGTGGLLRSAIENVVRNAVRHSPEGAEVNIVLRVLPEEKCRLWNRVGLVHGRYTSSRPEDATCATWAVISVCDRGPGIAVEQLEEVFRPFYRLSSARDRLEGGAGLGLTITARAVELHGGQFRVRNRSNGGLEIQLRLPVPTHPIKGHGAPD